MFIFARFISCVDLSVVCVEKDARDGTARPGLMCRVGDVWLNACADSGGGVIYADRGC